MTTSGRWSDWLKISVTRPMSDVVRCEPASRVEPYNKTPAHHYPNEQVSSSFDREYVVLPWSLRSLFNPPLALADSSCVKPRQTAIALGSPFGLTDSITLGVISGLGRSVVGGKTGTIQPDAGIQPGNSGGPLLDSRGEVIGVITAIEAEGSGIGFAIPSNVVKRELPGTKSGAQTTRP